MRYTGAYTQSLRVSASVHVQSHSTREPRTRRQAINICFPTSRLAIPVALSVRVVGAAATYAATTYAVSPLGTDEASDDESVPRQLLPLRFNSSN